MFDLRILSLTSVAENMLSGLTFGMVGVYMRQVGLGEHKKCMGKYFFSLVYSDLGISLTRYLNKY